MKPLAAGPPDINLFETDLQPDDAFASALTEIALIATPDSDEQRREKVQSAWKNYVAAVVQATKGVSSLSGVSVNLEGGERRFLGLIGWESQEVCFTFHQAVLLYLLICDSMGRREM